MNNLKNILIQAKLLSIKYYSNEKKIILITENNKFNNEIRKILFEKFEFLKIVDFELEKKELINKQHEIINLDNYDQQYYDLYYNTLNISENLNKNINVNTSKNNINNNFNNNINNKKYKKPENNNVIYKTLINEEATKIPELNKNDETILGQTLILEGEIFNIDSRKTKSEKYIFSFIICDLENTLKVKCFLSQDEFDDFQILKEFNRYKVKGKIKFDTYENDLILDLNAMNIANQVKIAPDESIDKRVELHAHTKMSELSGICEAVDLIERAKYYGHKAIAITDTSSVQSFPDIMKLNNNDFKIIYGTEFEVFDDTLNFSDIDKNYSLNESFIIFDIETTGFSPVDNKIIEIGAIKVHNGKIIDEFQAFVNPQENITDEISNLTNITNDMLKNAKIIDDVLPQFLDFCEGFPLVAHNANFDISFIKQKVYELNINYENFSSLDTLQLARLLLKDQKKFRLDKVAQKLGVILENHHRAIDDAKTTANIFIKFVNILKNNNIFNIEELNLYAKNNFNFQFLPRFEVVVLAKKQEGIKNIYKLISKAHIDFITPHGPMLPKSYLQELREPLLICASGKNGEIINHMLKSTNFAPLNDIINFYDYIEIQCLQNYKDIMGIGQELKDEISLKKITQRMYEISKLYNKKLVVSSNPHYLDEKDDIYRKIILNTKGKRSKLPLLTFKRTNELLKEFEYLGEQVSNEIIIENTQYISNLISTDILPIPKGTYPPEIEGCNESLYEDCYKKAKSIYGENLPEIVEKRLKRELEPIIKNGYGVMYVIAQKIVAKSMNDGYLVGSRGSVGSSFVATMAGITEVNPLIPHYICPKCKKSEFITDNSYSSGIDLPDKKCEKCNILLKKDGHNIPFETFLGFESDKEPDIDLNFAGEYQAIAHQYTEELFGKGNVYKAGTISKIQENTAFGFVKKYFEDNNIDKPKDFIEYLKVGCINVKRTSGQHPGGIMVVPAYKEIYDFTPIQYPANDSTKGVIITHFDYNSISGRILKLDLLGHDVPTQLRLLKDLTGFEPMEIPLDDKKVLSLFTSTDALNIKNKNYKEHLGVLGIPEFGTPFVRGMLDDIKPTTFHALVSISGLAHGTNVWLNNAKDLVVNEGIEFSKTICTRDDIMTYLISAGVEARTAFFIMESVRKGKGLKENDIEIMKKNNVPQWYIDSCQKIKYMFPRAHAVAYVMMSVRIAYYKVYYPREFYAAQFYSKLDYFDADIISQGFDAINNEMQNISNNPNASDKDKNKYVIYELALEMYARGYKCLKVDLYKSDATKFKIVDEGILPPLAGINGISNLQANQIIEYRNNGEILSINDLKKNAKLNKTSVESLRNHGCLDNLPEDNQLTFDMFI